MSSGRSDEELLSAFVAGDNAAFGEIFTHHRGRLWAVAMRVTGDESDASDALQDGVLRAMRSAAAFRGQSQVGTWLHRIVLNSAIDLVRQRHPQVGLDQLPAAETALPTAATDWDSRLDLERAFRELPPAQRLAVYLVDYEGWSVSDAAVRMGVAPGTVKSRCARGRARLAQALGGTIEPAAPSKVAQGHLEEGN